MGALSFLVSLPLCILYIDDIGEYHVIHWPIPAYPTSTKKIHILIISVIVAVKVERSRIIYGINY